MSIVIQVNDEFCVTRAKSSTGNKQLSLEKCSNADNQHFHLQSHFNLESNTQWYTVHHPKKRSECIDISGSNEPILEMFECGDSQPNQLFSFKQQQMHSGMTTCLSVTPTNILLAGPCDALVGVAKIDIVAAKFLKDFNDETRETSILADASINLHANDKLQQLKNIMNNPNPAINAEFSIFSSRSFLFVLFIVVCWGLRELLKLSRESQVASKMKVRKRRYQ